MCREEGDPIKGEGLQAARAPRQVKDPDHHAAQAEVDRPTVHDDPVMTLFNTDKHHRNYATIDDNSTWCSEYIQAHENKHNTHVHGRCCVWLYTLKQTDMKYKRQRNKTISTTQIYFKSRRKLPSIRSTGSLQ